MFNVSVVVRERADTDAPPCGFKERDILFSRPNETTLPRRQEEAKNLSVIVDVPDSAVIDIFFSAKRHTDKGIRMTPKFYTLWHHADRGGHLCSPKLGPSYTFKHAGSRHNSPFSMR